MATRTARAPSLAPSSGLGLGLGAGSTHLGYYAAILTAVIAAAFAAAGIATPPRSGPFCAGACIPAPYTAVSRFIPGDYLWLIPGILLAPTFVGLMACIHSLATERRRTLSLVALSFAAIYAVVILVNYFVQFTVVIPSLQSAETQNLSLFTQYNPHGFFIALEVLAYLMMSIALLVAAPVFVRGRIERAIRWLFILGFALTVAAFTTFWGVVRDLVAAEVTMLMINWAVLFAGGALLTIVFHRALRAQGQGEVAVDA